MPVAYDPYAPDAAVPVHFSVCRCGTWVGLPDQAVAETECPNCIRLHTLIHDGHRPRWLIQF